MITEKEEKISERKELLRRAYSINHLFEIGKWLRIPYFEGFSCCWDVDEDEAAAEISLRITDDDLKQIFQRYEPRSWVTFKGKHYLLINGKIFLEGSWSFVRDGLRRFKSMYGLTGVNLLKSIVESGGTINSYTIKDIIEFPQIYEMLSDLEDLGIIYASHIGEKFKEWSIPKEMLPIIDAEISGRKDFQKKQKDQTISLTEGEKRLTR